MSSCEDDVALESANKVQVLEFIANQISKHPEILNPTLDAIFASNLVVSEIRLGDSVTHTNPKAFVERLTTDFTKVKENFSQKNVQRDFYEAMATEKTKNISLTFKYDPQKRTSIMGQIESYLIKGTKVLKLGSSSFKLPAIKNDYCDVILNPLNVYTDQLFENIQATVQPGQPVIDIRRTKDKLFKYTKPRATALTTSPKRGLVYQHLAVIVLLEHILHTRDSEYVSFLTTHGTLEDLLTGGMFISSLPSSQNFETRANSMVSDDCFGVPLNVCYNLNLQQMRFLAQFIFSKDPVQRVNVKFHS
ncbi:unnamed protein product [Brassicogethes aeneus]|uniref:Uncharacterized protein n=1 Tax=Brassicogethes aeneus TaxID=1431903 RepID=A0A9P0BGU7_BRAAE|nr:unnamed protein product [Brassicogethes aeneus]